MSHEHSHLIRRLTEARPPQNQWDQPPVKGDGPEPEASGPKPTRVPKSQGFGSVKGVEAEAGDTHNETTIREVLQLGVDGLEMMFTSLADDIESNQEELANFDAPALVGHLRAAAEVLRNSTGA